MSVERATTLVREAVALDLPDSGVRLAGGGGTAVVTVTVSADTTERTIGPVPIAVRGAPGGAATAGHGGGHRAGSVQRRGRR